MNPRADESPISDREKAWRCRQAESLIALCGERYAGCRFATFEVTTDAQREALASVQDFAGHLDDNLKAGANLILFGPKGTGKDHLLFSLMLYGVIHDGFSVLAVDSGYRCLPPEPDKPRRSISWTNGMDMFRRLRDSFGSGGDSESDWQTSYTRPDVLAISDPLPPVGALTDFQKAALFGILDVRYRRLRPVWLTANVASGAELDERLGPQNADRLRDGAVVVRCNWDSYRRARA
ncbi:MAG: ATP-binding protein [Planctomycetaceae bacterium]|nr:ATP-binding protein [Planctomycetaceae bacterium]